MSLDGTIEDPLRKRVLKVRGRDASVLDMLNGMGALQASDLFLKTGSPVRFKISGRVVTFESDIIDRRLMGHIISCFLIDEDLKRFHERMVSDVVFATDKARYRVHFAYGNSGPYAAIRIISSEIKPFQALNMPESTGRNLHGLKGGLMIVCGTTDAGKTVTCTSLLEQFNRTREQAILTLEDPVEYIFEDKRSMVIQREVGLHVPSFSDGVKAALRENVDVIFVGETRETDTIEQVLRAAETGHTVITTMHADDTISAINRLIGSFSQPDQPRIRQSLAGVITGVLYQKLLPTPQGGRVPCVESIWANMAVRTILRSGDLTKLGSYVGRTTGGIGYRDYLVHLEQTKQISRDVLDTEMARLRGG